MKVSWQATRWMTLAILAACLVLLPHARRLLAQDNPDAAAQKARAEAMIKAHQGQPPGQPGQPPQASSNQPGKPPGDAGKKSDEVKSVQRPGKPAAPPDPKELEIRPDESGKVKLNFNGQPWPAILEWAAKISNMSLDWREMPDDFANITTQRSYTVPEVRGLINRHLLMRGYTMLCDGEMLTVAKTKDIDPSLVPRIDPKELEKHDPYEFAKTSFALDWMTAENALKELTPLKSPNGKLNALTATNRIEALDAVANLRDMQKLLQEEQSTESKGQLFKKFSLQYVRASDVLEQLQTLLEIESKPKSNQPKTPQQIQQEAMQAQMRAQQQGGQPNQPGQQPPGGPSAKTAVTLAANERENCILACAPPDKMVVISQIIEAVDVPPANAGQSLVGNISRMNPYRVAGIDPELVGKTLMEVGNLSPTTRLEVDKKNNLIIANAPLADHVVINAIVGKLCGSERKFKVIPLRKLPADSVAASIEFMMGIDTKKKQERPNYFSMWGGGRDASSGKTDEFRVEADLENNRLLLKGNEVELAEVDNLLVQLGEKPPRGGNPATHRVIDLGGAEQTQELIEHLQREWSRLAPNPLSLPSNPPKKADSKESPERRPTTPADEPAEPPSKTTDRRAEAASIQLTQLRQDRGAGEISYPAADSADAAPVAGNPPSPQPAKSPLEDSSPQAGPPPVTISIGPDGRIIVASDDAEALDLIEELASQIAARPKDYKVFHLRFASAYGVALNLQDYFKEEKKAGPRMPYWYYFEFGDDQDESGSDDRRMSKRRKLKFISDSDSNTILVQGADSTQLRVIEDLIKLYDQPPPSDTETERVTKTILLRHAKAKEVAETVKDVYRDLLSANDKALQGPNQQQGGRGGFVISYDYGSRGGDKGEQKVPRFKGLLSIGVSETSNSLSISAPKYLFEPVSKMIEELDRAAEANNAVRMVKVGPGLSALQLQEVLDSLMNPGAASRHAAKNGEKTQAPKSPATKDSRPGGNRNAGQGQAPGK